MDILNKKPVGFIYCTTNLKNGKKYIGQRRYYGNNSDNYYLGSGKLLKIAIKKYGRSNFKRQVLEYVYKIDLLNESEDYWMNKFNVSSNDIFYNIYQKSSYYSGKANGEEHRNYINITKSELGKLMSSGLTVREIARKLGHDCITITSRINKFWPNLDLRKRSDAIRVKKIPILKIKEAIDQNNNLIDAGKMIGVGKSTMIKLLKDNGLYNRKEAINRSKKALSKKVELLDKKLNLIKTFNSASEAKRELGNSVVDILRGRKKNINGFYLRYKGKGIHPNCFKPDKRNPKEIEAINKSGKVTLRYPSCNSAIKDGYTSVDLCLKGKVKMCGGYYWRVRGKEVHPDCYKEKHHKSKKPVEAIDNNGNIVFKFSSVLEAAKSGFNSVYENIHGKITHCGGYHWRYVGGKIHKNCKPVTSRKVDGINDKGVTIYTFESPNEARLNGYYIYDVLKSGGGYVKNIYWQYKKASI